MLLCLAGDGADGGDVVVDIEDTEQPSPSNNQSQGAEAGGPTQQSKENGGTSSAADDVAVAIETKGKQGDASTEQNENMSKGNHMNSVAFATKDKSHNNPGSESTNTHTIDVEITPEANTMETETSFPHTQDVDVGIRSNRKTSAHDEIRFIDDSSTDTEKGSPSTPVATACNSLSTNDTMETSIATTDSEPINSKHNSKHKLTHKENPTLNSTENGTNSTHNAFYGSESDMATEASTPGEQCNMNTTDKNHNIDLPSVEISDMPQEHEKFLTGEKEGKLLEVQDMTNVNQKMPITKL